MSTENSLKVMSINETEVTFPSKRTGIEQFGMLGEHTSPKSNKIGVKENLYAMPSPMNIKIILTRKASRTKTIENPTKVIMRFLLVGGRMKEIIEEDVMIRCVGPPERTLSFFPVGMVTNEYVSGFVS